MNTVAIIQARSESSRLPNKIFAEINGRPMLQIVAERLRRCKMLDRIVIATTTSPADDKVVRLAESMAIGVYRGSANDVLDRFHNAAKEFKADTIVRITADCPLVSPTVVDKVIIRYKMSQVDYALAISRETNPLGYPRGTNVEVFSLKILDELNALPLNQEQREHVTLFMEENPHRFHVEWVEAETELQRPHYRLTVDTGEDLELIRKIYSGFPREEFISLEGAVKLLDNHPDYLKINSRVVQKQDSGELKDRTSRRTIVFRVDANRPPGAGHWTRCLDLADLLSERGYRPVFLSSDSPILRNLLSDRYPLITLNNYRSKNEKISFIRQQMDQLVPLATVADLNDADHDERLAIRQHSGYLVDINDLGLSNGADEWDAGGDADAIDKKIRSLAGKVIMILGAGIEQVPLIKTAKCMGLQIVAIDRNPLAEGFAFSDYHYDLDIGAVDALLTVAKKHKIDAAITTTEFGVNSASAISGKLGLPGGRASILSGFNKLKLKDILRKHNVHTPDHRIVMEFAECSGAVAGLGLPVIFKPCDNAGARGVMKVNKTEEIEKAFNFAITHTRREEIIVEKFLEGEELGCEAYVRDGRVALSCFTDKRKSEEPFNVVMGHTFPAGISTEIREKCEALVQEAINAFEFSEGPVNFDIILSPEGPSIIDVGFRLGGNHLPLLVYLATGINTYKESIKTALGLKPDLEPRTGRCASVFYLEPMPGKITKISSFDHLSAIEGVVSYSLDVKEGDVLPDEIFDASQRKGVFITTAGTLDQLSNVRKSVFSTLQIQTKADSKQSVRKNVQ